MFDIIRRVFDGGSICTRCHAMNADHLDTAGRAKTRHYQKLASELKKFSESVGDTRTLFTKLEGDLLSMRTLAGLHAAQ